jgi:hypothetical protein
MSISPDIQYVLIYGNLSDGFEFLGPFKSFDQASDYALDRIEPVETWITPLYRPLEKGRDYD